MKAYKAIRNRQYTNGPYGLDLYMNGEERIFLDKSEALLWLGCEPGRKSHWAGAREDLLTEIEIVGGQKGK